ncbi:MAG: response regulator [Anaerolineales bacterium]|nr:response regulator [Anaerolineales bacterium]
MTNKTRVLIVDDQPGMLRTTAMVLNRKGYHVDIAQNGPAALEKIKQIPFDVVLMDIKMPVMSGVDTYQYIKNIRPATAVIMMTAYAVEDLVSEAMEKGAFAVIYKPLDIDRTIGLIEKAHEMQKGIFIQIVDDDPNACNTLRIILERKGYSVAIAPDGETAIEQAIKFEFDIILIDLKLPTINGLETYLAIREIDPDVVAIMMTAFRDEMADIINAGLKQDIYACLYKPLNMDELLELLEHIVSFDQKTRTFNKE